MPNPEIALGSGLGLGLVVARLICGSESCANLACSCVRAGTRVVAAVKLRLRLGLGVGVRLGSGSGFRLGSALELQLGLELGSGTG